MDELLAIYAGLVGVAALIAFLINVLKAFGVVKDGQAQTWSAALNLLFLAALLAVRVFKPELNVNDLDKEIGKFVEVAIVVFGYVLQLLGSKVAHVAIRGVPLVGKSYS